MAIEPKRPRQLALCNVDYAYHDRCLAWPFEPPACLIYRAALRANPPQPGRTRVSLANGVGGDQTKATVWTQERECAPEKVGHKVRIPVRLLMEHFEPIRIGARMRSNDR